MLKSHARVIVAGLIYHFSGRPYFFVVIYAGQPARFLVLPTQKRQRISEFMNPVFIVHDA
jgi:hypothetical protein